MAGRIPQAFIDELLNRIDIIEVVDSRVPLKKKGKEYMACCPFHNEKTPSFTVSQEKQFYHCFGCKAHGTAVGFLMDYEHLSFPEAIEELAKNVGLAVPYEGGQRDIPVPKKQDGIDLYELMGEVDTYYQQQLRQHPQSRQAVNYLKGRGLSGEIAKEFGIGFAPAGWENLLKTLGTEEKKQKALVTAGMLIEKDDGKLYDRFRQRIMFPIRDRRGRTIAFGGRVINPDDKGAKYLNSPETPLFHKSQELYGLYEARQALRDIPRLMVVEGYMDVVSLAQFGIRYAVATLGTATTQEHLHRLFRVSKEVVFCFDGDRAGREAANRALHNALPVMREGRMIRFMFLPEGEDPDTLVRRIGKEALELQISQAMPFSEFFFQLIQQGADIGSTEGRAQVVNNARPLLLQLPPGIYRSMLIDQLAQFSRKPANEIEALLSQPVAKAVAGESRQHSQSAPASPPPAGKRTHTSHREPHSLMRKALTRLLYRPVLAEKWDDMHSVDKMQQPGANLLREVLEILKVNPDLSTSALLERWRDTENGPMLARLASWQPLTDEETAVEAEFIGAMEKLAKETLELRLDDLRLKSEQGPLTNEEKTEFHQLVMRLKS